MIEKIAKYLIENHFVLAVAESCTGGLISSLFTDVKGASKYIEQNFVTYSAASKVQLLGVNPNTIKKYRVVSEEVAKEMAQGLVLRYGADFGLSTTGKLDGAGGGRVFIGVSYKGKTEVLHYVSKEKTRVSVKYDIAHHAINFLWEKINETNR